MTWMDVGSYTLVKPTAAHLVMLLTLALAASYSQTITGNTCSSVSAGSPT